MFASNLWLDLFENDPLSRDAGHVIQDKILRHGGSKDPALMLKVFRCLLYCLSALLSALLSAVCCLSSSLCFTLLSAL